MITERLQLGAFDVFVRRSEGPAPTLYFLPGGVVDHIDLTWKNVVRRMATRHRVVAPDLPGFGLSRGLPPEGYSSDFVRRFAGAFMDALALNRPVLIANSMSAGAALDLALERPEQLRGLVISGGYGWQPRVPLHTLGYLLANMPGAPGLVKWLGRREWFVRGGLRLLVHERDDVDAELLQDGLDGAAAPEVGDAFMGWLRSELGPRHVRTDRRPTLPQIRIPVMILQGTHDWLTPEVFAREAAALIPGAEYVTLETNHLLPREDPDEAERLIEAFVSRVAD